MKKVLGIILLFGAILGLASCTSTDNNGPETKEQQINRLIHYADTHSNVENQSK